MKELKPLHDMRKLKGGYDEITLKENYINTDTRDYMHIILTDEEDIPDAIGKLRAIYPNIMKLEYDNARTAIFAVLGFCIGTLKVPDNSNIPFFKKTGGENIDDVILRWIKFKKQGNKIYIYKPEEETKDEQ